MKFEVTEGKAEAGTAADQLPEQRWAKVLPGSSSAGEVCVRVGLLMWFPGRCETVHVMSLYGKSLRLQELPPGSVIKFTTE